MTLKLGKGSAFVKSRLRRLPQSENVWEADFLPEADHWMGLVVAPEHGAVFAMKMLEAAPGVNDLAQLLSDAMYRALYDCWHRPQTIRLRDNPEWQQLVRHLHALRVDAEFSDDLPAWVDAIAEYQSPLDDLEPDMGGPLDIEHLAFPFTAEHGEEYGHPERVKFIGFNDPDEPMIDETYGILCEARMEGRVVTLPLGELDEVKGKPNRQLIEDYCYWLHNWC